MLYSQFYNGRKQRTVNFLFLFHFSKQLQNLFSHITRINMFFKLVFNFIVSLSFNIENFLSNTEYILMYWTRYEPPQSTGVQTSCDKSFTIGSGNVIQVFSYVLFKLHWTWVCIIIQKNISEFSSISSLRF